MAHTQALHRNANAVYRLVYHLVLVTRYRKKVLTGAMLDRASAILSGLCEAWEGCLLECSGEVDHLHALIDLPPKVRPTDIINNLIEKYNLSVDEAEEIITLLSNLKKYGAEFEMPERHIMRNA